MSVWKECYKNEIEKQREVEREKQRKEEERQKLKRVCSLALKPKQSLFLSLPSKSGSDLSLAEFSWNSLPPVVPLTDRQRKRKTRSASSSLLPSSSSLFPKKKQRIFSRSFSSFDEYDFIPNDSPDSTPSSYHKHDEQRLRDDHDHNHPHFWSSSLKRASSSSLSSSWAMSRTNNVQKEIEEAKEKEADLSYQEFIRSNQEYFRELDAMPLQID
eukprot:TRINITY_DN7428_c0_g1_i1.p1 TRINITY_DN7428_c0_g1~~TRINITY_DN7428_c0_g1_i1.p1  ORF type:complete len:214 (+),score=76.21 TRINITY_DN7428_c0_g1_i1:124-765(+)